MPRGDDNGKIFVGGLSYETTKEGLESYFSKYGEIGDCVIMKAKDQADPRIERSRGFGFVTFCDPNCVQKVIDSRPHYLDNKEIDPKPAVPRTPGSQGPMPIPKTTTGSRSFKIFIGGVAQGTTEEDLKNFFSSFGPVADVSLMKDVKTGRMRGFGFVGFHTEEPVTKICAIRYHQINGKTVEAKKAEPRDSRTPSVINGNNAMGRGMAMQQAYAPAAYGMSPYAQDARAMYGAGYGGQAVTAQASPYGVPGVSVAASQYSGYGVTSSVSAIPSSYADRTGAMGQDPTVAQAYGAYGTMGIYGAVGAPTTAATARFSEYTTVPQGQAMSSAASAMPTRSEVAAADFPGYAAYGLGNYPQEASQYGPTRGGLADGAFAGVGAATAGAAGVPASVYGADPSGYPSVSMYDGVGRGSAGGGSNSTRGYHPYGR